MAVRYIFFGGIGTLVETSEAQLEAFNKAFRENNIDYFWERDSYIKTLNKSGGIQRLKTIKLNCGSTLDEQQIVEIHADKTRIYNESLRTQGLQLRTGASELIAHAINNHVKLVWATTTTQTNIDAIFDALGDSLKKDVFIKITNKDLISRQKPDPEVYLKLLSSLNTETREVLVIEDSVSGVESASSAGLTTLAFPGDMTSKTTFNASYQRLQSLTETIAFVNELDNVTAN